MFYDSTTVLWSCYLNRSETLIAFNQNSGNKKHNNSKKLVCGCVKKLDLGMSQKLRYEEWSVSEYYNISYTFCNILVINTNMRVQLWCKNEVVEIIKKDCDRSGIIN